VTQETPACQQHEGEEEEKDGLREDLSAEDNERRRERSQNSGDQPDPRRDQGAERGNERAGPGIDDRLQDCRHPGSIAEHALDAAEQQRIKRHAVGFRHESRPEALRSRQPGAERPIGERVLLREEGIVAGKEREIDQANQQRQHEYRLERMNGETTGDCGDMHRCSRNSPGDHRSAKRSRSVVGMPSKRQATGAPDATGRHV